MFRLTGLPARWRFTKRRSANDEKAFTLLEVLIAFAILAVMLVPILQVFGSGLGTSATARAYATATELARAKLAEIDVGGPLIEGEQSGAFDEPGYEWRRTIVADTSSMAALQEGAGPATGTEKGADRKPRGQSRERSGFVGAAATSSTGSSRRAESSDERSGPSNNQARPAKGEQSVAEALPEGLRAFWVTVTVAWQTAEGQGTVTLSTFRLAPAEPEGLDLETR